MAAGGPRRSAAGWFRGATLAGAATAAVLPAVLVPLWITARWRNLTYDADLVFPVLVPSGAAAVALAILASISMRRHDRLTQQMVRATALAILGFLLSVLAATSDWDDSPSFGTFFLVVLPSFGFLLVAGCIMIFELLARFARGRREAPADSASPPRAD